MKIGCDISKQWAVSLKGGFTRADKTDDGGGGTFVEPNVNFVPDFLGRATWTTYDNQRRVFSRNRGAFHLISCRLLHGCADELRAWLSPLRRTWTSPQGGGRGGKKVNFSPRVREEFALPFENGGLRSTLAQRSIPSSVIEFYMREPAAKWNETNLIARGDALQVKLVSTLPRSGACSVVSIRRQLWQLLIRIGSR